MVLNYPCRADRKTGRKFMMFIRTLLLLCWLTFLFTQAATRPHLSAPTQKVVGSRPTDGSSQVTDGPRMMRTSF